MNGRVEAVKDDLIAQQDAIIAKYRAALEKISGTVCPFGGPQFICPCACVEDMAEIANKALGK